VSTIVLGGEALSPWRLFCLLTTKRRRFHFFFNQIDNFRTDYFLWVTAGGVDASHERMDRGIEKVPTALQTELGDEADGVEEVGT
jgi:tRNA pseudouridine38-40 synthase